MSWRNKCLCPTRSIYWYVIQWIPVPLLWEYCPPAFHPGFCCLVVSALLCQIPPYWARGAIINTTTIHKCDDHWVRSVQWYLQTPPLKKGGTVIFINSTILHKCDDHLGKRVQWYLQIPPLERSGTVIFINTSTLKKYEDHWGRGV